jgi:hypothetical protein
LQNLSVAYPVQCGLAKARVGRGMDFVVNCWAVDDLMPDSEMNPSSGRVEGGWSCSCTAGDFRHKSFGGGVCNMRYLGANSQESAAS